MLEPREYSKRLGTITHEQLQASLDRFGLGRLVSAASAPGGLFGQIVLLTTDAGQYALRGHPHEGQLEREHFVAELIHARTSVPVPWPYLVDRSTDIFGWPYALMPRLHGVQLADPEVRQRLERNDRLGVAVAMAECLARLHEAAFDWHGVFDAKTGRYERAGQPYAEWFGAWTRWWLDRCREASDATTDDDVRWVEQVIADAHGALAEPFVPSLVHTDFKEGNAVAERHDRRWQISGIFDLAETFLGDGEYDLARAYCEYSRDVPLACAYLETYLRAWPPRPGFAQRMRHYILHDRLIIWEYGQRNDVWFKPGETLRSWAERYLELPSLNVALS